MKRTLLTLLASLSLLAVIPSAQADCHTPRRLIGYTECGTPIYSFYEIVGRSSCGEPIFRWVTHYPSESSRYFGAPRHHSESHHHHDDDDDHHSHHHSHHSHHHHHH